MAARTLSRKVFPANTVIFKEGDEANCAYLLKSGQVEITTMRGDQIVHLTSVQPRQLFGEMALMDGSLRSATATVLKDSEVIIVYQHDIDQQLAKLDPFMRYWIDYLTERVKDLSTRAFNPGLEGDDRNTKPTSQKTHEFWDLE